jgi:50S ribosomal protein L16 3-hydroxylase
MILSQWFSELTSETFREQHFEKAPIAQPRVARQAIPFMTWETVERILERDDVEMVVARNGALFDHPAPRSLDELKALFAIGGSISIRRVEELDAGVRLLAEKFAREFESPVNVHIFATPANYTGFGWHYDCEDVFIAQTEGTKEYFLRENTVNPHPRIDTMPKDMQFERETTPMMSTTLIAGDWLYIPGGWWHVAKAREDSLHLSIGVLLPKARARS